MEIIGIGTDITEIERIERMVEKHEKTFLTRVFTPRELDYCGKGPTAGEHLAGRWAAKEAVLKAFGTGWSDGIAWTDVEVLSAPSGKPSIRLTGRAAEIALSSGIDAVLISITHCRTYAAAFAVAVGNPKTPGGET